MDRRAPVPSVRDLHRGEPKADEVNTAEARAAESQRDFLHKLRIAEKEARETLYWLRLMSESEMLPMERLAALLQEVDEITRILVTISRNAKRNAES